MANKENKWSLTPVHLLPHTSLVFFNSLICPQPDCNPAIPAWAVFFSYGLLKIRDKGVQRLQKSKLDCTFHVNFIIRFIAIFKTTIDLLQIHTITYIIQCTFMALCVITKKLRSHFYIYQMFSVCPTNDLYSQGGNVIPKKHQISILYR